MLFTTLEATEYNRRFYKTHIKLLISNVIYQVISTSLFYNFKHVNHIIYLFMNGFEMNIICISLYVLIRHVTTDYLNCNMKLLFICKYIYFPIAYILLMHLIFDHMVIFDWILGGIFIIGNLFVDAVILHKSNIFKTPPIFINNRIYRVSPPPIIISIEHKQCGKCSGDTQEYHSCKHGHIICAKCFHEWLNVHCELSKNSQKCVVCSTRKWHSQVKETV